MMPWYHAAPRFYQWEVTSIRDIAKASRKLLPGFIFQPGSGWFHCQECFYGCEDSSINVDSRGGGRTPLSWAAVGRHEAVVKLLLDTGEVDVDSKGSKGSKGSKDRKYRRTLLSWAAVGGHEAVVKLLLDMGKVDVDSEGAVGHHCGWLSREETRP
jgi:hypothetical protein